MTSPDACLPGQRSPRARRSSAGSDFASILWLQTLSSLHQTPIGTLSRSRFASVSQKLVRALARPFKVDLAHDVQLSPGSREGQSLSKERPSAPHECSEGRWISNQDGRLPGSVQEALRHSRLGLSPRFSIEKPAPVGRLDHPPPLLSPRPGQETIHLEDALLAEDQIHGATELRGQNRQRLALA
jgi:hypothetical protein